MIKKYKINIIGSTGEIGSKTLYILKKFPITSVSLVFSTKTSVCTNVSSET